MEFLSPAWFEQLDAAVRTLEVDRTSLRVEIQVDATSAPATARAESPIRYQLAIDDAGPRIEVEPTDRADVRLCFDRRTAVDIALGRCSAQTAIATGRFRLQGRPDRLADAAAALSALGAATEQLRDRTRYTT